MKAQKTSTTSWFYLGALLLLTFSGLAPVPKVEAQTACPSLKGNNAVWGTCPGNGQLEVVGTTAIVDASAWCNGNCNFIDFCLTLNSALTAVQNDPNLAQGAVVDARGIVYSDGSGETCTINPFSGITVPSTVLLPASEIDMTLTWVLPSNTRILGQGRRTILQATSGFITDVHSSANAMIEMGDTAVCASGLCTGIAIAHLKIDGGNFAGANGAGLTGIHNGNAQDSSYVEDVDFRRIGAEVGQSALTTGLLIDSGAAGSGPYSNLDFSLATSTNCGGLTCTPTTCIQIRAATRGVHGVTCVAGSNNTTGPAAGIYLDASNNTIEDIHLEGYHDGIVVGDDADGLHQAVAGNVIRNVTGDYGGPKSGPTTNTIHICNPALASGSQTGGCVHSASAIPATDLGIFQAESVGGSQTFAAQTILDDLTTATINSLPVNRAYVSAYILGEPLGGSPPQYSRFTTAPAGALGTNAPTWAVGNTAPVAHSACTSPGALYSNTTGSGSGTTNSNTLFVCTGAPATWQAVTNQ